MNSADPTVHQADTPCRKKILFVVTEDWYFHSHRLAHAVAAVAAGYDVSVATREAGHGDLIRSAGIDLIPFEMTRRGFNPFAELLTVFRLSILYRSHKPDIVHHVALKPVIFGSLAAWLARVPAMVNAVAGLGYAFTSGDGRAKALRSAIGMILPRLLNRRGSRVIVQNPDDGGALAGMGVEQRRIVLIRGAGVDPQMFRAEQMQAGPPIVVLACRMIWGKGVRAFVAAAQAVRSRFPEARFVLVGKPDPGNPNAVPESQLADWNRAGPVEWWGFRTDMPQVLREMHIMCFPSTYGEGVPKILIEAAASGKPIVATDIPGCREVVLHGESGFLVMPGDHEALVAALVELIGDPGRRTAMGLRGRAHFEQNLALDGVVDATLRVYAEALRE